MAKILSKERREKIISAIYQKANDIDYSTCSRRQSGVFLDQLVEDPEIGGVLNEYYSKERIRTYIKDAVLNAYMKNLKAQVLTLYSPEDVVSRIYGCATSVIQKQGGDGNSVTVLRSETGAFYIVSKGTVLKWETALRKALELVAREPGLTINGNTPKIILVLASIRCMLTEADKEYIFSALRAINVKAFFC